MIRNLKVLGLALVAMLTMGALASAASAAEFTAGAEEVSIVAEQVKAGDHEFVVDGASVICDEANFATDGEVAAPASSVTVHPVYGGCDAFGFVNATVNTGECDFVLDADGEIDVACAEGSVITITAASCEVTVGSQTGLSEVSYTNENTNPDEVLVGADVSGIAVNKKKDGFLCPLSGTGAGTGTYTGDTLAEGYSGEEQVDISVD